MSIICINGWRPSEVYDEFKKSILEGRIRPSDYKKVIIDYDCYEWPAAEGTPEFYPIKFIGNENELWLSQITTGAGIARAGASAAGVVFLMIPPIVLFLIMESNVVETMASAAIKE